MPSPEATQASFAGALRQVFNQLLRMLEEPDPSVLLSDRGAMAASLESWRKTIAAQTADPSIQKVRKLQEANLELRGKGAVLEKECSDLKERNGALRDELVKLNQHEESIKQRLFDAQFEAKTHKEEAKELDLEVRDLRRKVRKLEGGPPLTPSEAAPRGTTKGKSKAKTKAKAKAKKKSVAPTPEVQPADQAGLTMEAMRAAPSSARNAVEEAFKSMWKQPPPPVVEEAAPKQAAPTQATPKKAAPKKTAPKKTAPKKAAAKKAASKKAAAKKAAPKKTAAKKAAAKKTVAKKAAPKKTAAKKAAAKKTAAKKAAAKKTAAKKAAPKKTAAKKAAPKKAAAKKAAPKKAAPKKKAADKKPGTKKKTKTKRSAA